MAKFRKKPMIVDAEQWFPGKEIEGVDESAACQDAHDLKYDQAWCDTLEGGHVVCSGDWIITGVIGEKYPCKPDVFEMTYESVEQFKEGVINGLREIIRKSVKRAFPGELDSRDKEYLKLLERKP